MPKKVFKIVMLAIGVVLIVLAIILKNSQYISIALFILGAAFIGFALR